jgi:hypothetical protein
MFTPKQYRSKAAEYAKHVEKSRSPKERREFEALQRRFSELADNEQWLADRHQRALDVSERTRSKGATLAEEEEHLMLCLGAALMMQWNTLPAKLQRELFDNAGAMGELLDTAVLRGQLARFLHKHKNGTTAT